MSRSQKQILLLSQHVLLATAILILGYCAFVLIAMRRYQEQAEDKLATVVRTSSLGSSDQVSPKATDRPKTLLESGGIPLVGRIEIPRTHLSAIVAEGTSSEVLRMAVGHVAGTSLPGENGNIALAAHRDTLFRGLGELQPGDLIRLTAPNGQFDYRVGFTEVVSPADTWVLESSSNQDLTLITCYPFHYIGSAPKRFIVRAFRVNSG